MDECSIVTLPSGLVVSVKAGRGVWIGKLLRSGSMATCGVNSTGSSAAVSNGVGPEASTGATCSGGSWAGSSGMGSKTCSGGLDAAADDALVF